MHRLLSAVLSIALLAAPSFAEKINPANKDAVERRLVSHFPLTQFDMYRGPGRIGAIVELLKPGLEAAPVNAIFPAMSYKGGFIRRTGAASLLGVLMPIPPGTRLFVTRVEAKENHIIFDVVTTEPINGVFFKSALHVEFNKGFLDNPDFTRIDLTVNEVLAVDRGQEQQQPPPSNRPNYPPPSYQQQQQPQQPNYPPQRQAPVNDPPPPPPPPSEPPPPPAPPAAGGSQQPVDLQLGMTGDQVRAAMGKPNQVVKLGTKEILIYPGAKVTLVNGKVTNIE